MKTVLITGGTGLTGKSLTKALLQKGYKVIVLTRSAKAPAQAPNLSYAQWNIDTQTIDAEAVSQAHYIVHLAGAPVVEKRWTTKRKKEITDSRVKSGELLLKTLARFNHHVEAVISASATGWYGQDIDSRNKQVFTETDPASPDFLGQTCQQWEASVDPFVQMGIRLVKFRLGIVLSKEGGALKAFMRPMKSGILPIMGKGKQTLSWIHIDDVSHLFLQALEDEKWNGVYNAVAPSPVSNRQLMEEIARQQNRKRLIPFHIPAFLLKAVLGKRSSELLKSATVSSEKIQQAGYVFRYPGIGQAMQQLLHH